MPTTTYLKCPCCNCCHLEIAVEYTASREPSDTFDLYAVHADLPGGELLIGRVEDEADADGGACNAAGFARGVIFLPASFDGFEPDVPDDVIDLADYTVLYVASLDTLASLGLCDLTFQIRPVANKQCGAAGTLYVYTVCRDDPVETDALLFNSGFASTAGSYPWANTNIATGIDGCCGIPTVCCGVAGVRVPTVLTGTFTGSVSATVDLVFDPTQTTEADSHPWVAEFTHNGHTITCWFYCVPTDGTYTFLTWCDLDALMDDFFDAFGSSSGDPEYDAQWDLYPPGLPDGRIDSADLFFLLAHLGEYAFGSGGIPSGTNCNPLAISITKTLGVAVPCTTSGADFTLEVSEP